MQRAAGIIFVPRENIVAGLRIFEQTSKRLFKGAVGRPNGYAETTSSTEHFGSVEQAVAAGLAQRYNDGACFRSAHYQAEIDFLAISRSPGYPYEPETNAA